MLCLKPVRKPNGKMVFVHDHDYIPAPLNFGCYSLPADAADWLHQHHWYEPVREALESALSTVMTRDDACTYSIDWMRGVFCEAVNDAVQQQSVAAELLRSLCRKLYMLQNYEDADTQHILAHFGLGAKVMDIMHYREANGWYTCSPYDPQQRDYASTIDARTGFYVR